MQKLVLVILTFVGLQASASPALILNSADSAALAKILKSEFAFQTKVEIGCYDPQGTDVPSDARLCHLSSTQGPVTIVEIPPSALAESLTSILMQNKDRFFLGMGQGWDGYGGVLTCTESRPESAACTIVELN